MDWLAGLPHREKILIAGNHDSYFDAKSRKDEDKGKKLNFRSLHYLENKAITLKFKGGRKLNFYGAPDIPKCGGRDMASVSSFPVMDQADDSDFNMIDRPTLGRIEYLWKQMFS